MSDPRQLTWAVTPAVQAWWLLSAIPSSSASASWQRVRAVYLRGLSAVSSAGGQPTHRPSLRQKRGASGRFPRCPCLQMRRLKTQGLKCQNEPVISSRTDQTRRTSRSHARRSEGSRAGAQRAEAPSAWHPARQEAGCTVAQSQQRPVRSIDRQVRFSRSIPVEIPKRPDHWGVAVALYAAPLIRPVIRHVIMERSEAPDEVPMRSSPLILLDVVHVDICGEVGVQWPLENGVKDGKL